MCATQCAHYFVVVERLDVENSAILHKMWAFMDSAVDLKSSSSLYWSERCTRTSSKSKGRINAKMMLIFFIEHYRNSFPWENFILTCASKYFFLSVINFPPLKSPFMRNAISCCTWEIFHEKWNRCNFMWRLSLATWIIREIRIIFRMWEMWLVNLYGESRWQRREMIVN